MLRVTKWKWTCKIYLIGIFTFDCFLASFPKDTSRIDIHLNLDLVLFPFGVSQTKTSYPKSNGDWQCSRILSLLNWISWKYYIRFRFALGRGNDKIGFRYACLSAHKNYNYTASCVDKARRRREIIKNLILHGFVLIRMGKGKCFFYFMRFKLAWNIFLLPIFDFSNLTLDTASIDLAETVFWAHLFSSLISLIRL